jgi:hypothetical protein
MRHSQQKLIVPQHRIFAVESQPRGTAAQKVYEVSKMLDQGGKKVHTKAHF